MAQTGDAGLFVPPETARELRELAAHEREARWQITRRLAFRWAGWAAIGALLGQWSLGFLFGFFYPRKLGAFGGTVAAGSVSDYKVGDVRVIREGKFYITRVPEGFLALYWRCTHLGCTVPWKENDPVEAGGGGGAGDTAFAQSGRFNCPCHGSIYTRYGQIVKGPAPRPLDRFPLRVAGGKLLVDTGPNNVITRGAATPDQAVAASSGPPAAARTVSGRTREL